MFTLSVVITGLPRLKDSTNETPKFSPRDANIDPREAKRAPHFALPNNASEKIILCCNPDLDSFLCIT